MNAEKYPLKAGSRYTYFEFTSDGPRGTIRKLIKFQKTANSDVYNLAFGDFDPQSQVIDDLATSGNGDTEKVLATVIKAVYTFFDQYPDVFVYATGSTKSRTRLYRMGITRFYDEMKKDFYLYG